MERKKYSPYFHDDGDPPEGKKYKPVVFEMHPESKTYAGSTSEGIGKQIQKGFKEVFGRKTQLPISVIISDDSSVAAVLWLNPVTQKCHIVAVADGQRILTPDPAFLPYELYAPGVRIVDTSRSYPNGEGQPTDPMRAMLETLKSLPDITTELVMMEDIAQAQPIPLQPNGDVLKEKRIHF